MKGLAKYFVLLGTTLTNVPLCITLYYGNLSVYIYSIHYSRSDLDSFDIDVSWLFPVYMVCRFIGTFIVDRCSRRIGLKWTSLCGMVTTVSGTFLTYFTVSHSVWATTTTLTLIGGLGNSLVVICNFLYVARWFKEHAGFATSTIICGSAIGGVIINQMITSYINPDNLSPDANIGHISYFSQSRVVDRIPMVFVVIGIFTVCFEVIGFCFLKDPPATDNSGEESSPLIDSKSHDKDTATFREDRVDLFTSEKGISNLKEGENGALSELANSFDSQIVKDEVRSEHSVEGFVRRRGNSDNETISGSQERPSLKPLQVLKSRTFYCLECALFAQSVGLLAAENYFKVFGQLWISDDQFLATIGSTMALSVIVSMPPCGFLVDKFGVKNTIAGHLAVSTIFVSLWYFVAQPSKWLYLLWVIIVFDANFNQFVMYPMAALRLFGKEHYAANFGLVQISSLLVYVVGPPLLTSILTTLGWFWLFFISACFTFASLMFVLIIMPS